MEGSEIDKALEDLETRIERLRALYEQYFMGIEKLEPQIPRKEIDRRITLFRKEQIRNTAQRFKFQTLIQRYNTMQQYWSRVTREIENGTFRRDVLKAAARFGETEALTILGKKKAKQYAGLLAAQSARQAPGSAHEIEEVELSGDDLLEEDLSIDDPVSAQSSSRTPPPQSAQSAGAGLRWGAGPIKPVTAVPPSGGDPRSDVRTAEAQSGVKRRVAELAAAMKAAKVQDEPGPGFGALDLDFEDPSAARGAGARGPAAMGPLPTVKPPSGGRPGAPAKASTSFGALDLPFDEDDAPTPTSKLRAPPAVGPRPTAAPPGASKPPAVSFGALDLDFDPAAPPKPAEPPSHRRPAGPVTPTPMPGRPGGPLRPSPFAGQPPGTHPPGMPAPGVPTPSAPPGARAIPGVPARPTGMPGANTRPFARPDPTLRPPTAPGAPPAPIAPAARAPVVAAQPPGMRPVPTTPPAATPRPVMATPSAAPPGGDAGLPDQRIRQLYSKYVDAKRAANESTAGVTYEKLAETLRAQATKLRQSHPAKSVDYEVVMKDGRPHLKPILR